MPTQDDVNNFSELQEAYLAVFASPNAKPEHVAVDARKFAEFICRRLFVKEFKTEPDSTLTLEGYLKVFRERKAPFRHAYPLIMTIQNIGNYAGHDQANPEPITEGYVQPALCAVDELMNWYVHNQLQRNDLQFSKGQVVPAGSVAADSSACVSQNQVYSVNTVKKMESTEKIPAASASRRLSKFMAVIRQKSFDAWMGFNESLERVSKSFVWFFLTFLIGIIPMVIFWLTEKLWHRHDLTGEELILRGDILAFSLVLISSLVWDYVILENRNKMTLIEKFVFYGMPLVTIPSIAVVYAFCQIGSPQEAEFVISLEIWILALTAMYAILTKLRAC